MWYGWSPQSLCVKYVENHLSRVRGVAGPPDPQHTPARHGHTQKGENKADCFGWLIITPYLRLRCGAGVVYPLSVTVHYFPSNSR